VDNEDLSLKSTSLINWSNPVPAPECPNTKHQNDVGSRRPCDKIYFPNDTWTLKNGNYTKYKAPVVQLQLPLEKKVGIFQSQLEMLGKIKCSAS